MISKTPYLINAMRNWAMDSGQTPQLLVDVEFPGVKVPLEKISVEDGVVILNVHNRAINEFNMVDGWILFSTRFGGQAYSVNIPVEAVIAIFVRETLEGMTFRQAVNQEDVKEKINTQPKDVRSSGKPHLKLVK